MNVDLGGLLVVAGISLAIYATWIAVWLCQPWPFAEVLLVACVSWWCQVLATQLVLGWLGILNPQWLGAVTAALLLALWWFALRHSRKDILLTHWSALRGGLGALRSSPAALIMLLLLGTWSAWIIFLALILPPYAFDEHYYHLPIAASFLQDQRIGFIPSHIPWISAYPKNSELFVLWNCIWLHRDTLADLTMLPFSLAGGLAVYAAGRRLGASVAAACLAASIFSFSPTVLIQAKSTYNDVMQGAIWAAAICFLLPFSPGRARPGGYSTAVVTGVLAGLLAGTKYTGLVFVPALAALLVLAAHRAGGWHLVLPMLGLFALGAALTAGYWYALNIVTFHNPFWPFTLRFGQHVIFEGSISPTDFAASDSSVKLVGPWAFWQRWLYTWFDHEAVFALDTRLGGFGPLWIVLGLPSVVLWLGVSLARLRWQIVGVIAVHVLTLLLLPFNWIPRYTLLILVLGGCGFAAVYPWLERWLQRGIAVLVVCLALFAVINSVDLLFFSVPTIRLYAALPNNERTDTRFDPGAWFGPTYQWVEHLVPPGSVIGYGSDVLFLYPLWGTGFEHRVIALPGPPNTCVEGAKHVGAHFAFVSAKGMYAACLNANRQAQLLFAGGDGWAVFKIQ